MDYLNDLIFKKLSGLSLKTAAYILREVIKMISKPSAT